MSDREVVPLFSQIVKGIHVMDIAGNEPAIRNCSLRRRADKKNTTQELKVGQSHKAHHTEEQAKNNKHFTDNNIRKDDGGDYSTRVISDRKTKTRQNEQSKETLEDEDEKLSKQNKDLSQDLFMLKNVVIRLNMELENVQDKSREYLMRDKDACEDFELSRDLAVKQQPTWGRSDMNAVAPLLQAYQEAIEDKDKLIKNFRGEINKFSGHCKKVVSDNVGLLKQLSEEKKKCESMLTEWEVMHKEVVTTKEQNRLLCRQSKLHQNSIIELQNTFREHLLEMSMVKEQTEERLLKSQMQLYALRGKFSILTEECDNLKSDANQKIPVTVHRAAVMECKRLFEELKLRYEGERDTLIKKMAFLSAFSSQADGDIQMVDLTSERDELANQNKTLEKEMKKLEEENQKLEVKLKQSERNREICKKQLSQVLGFAKELISEQEYLLVKFSEKQVADELRSDITTRIGQLQTRLRSVERGACRELEGMEQKFKEHASGIGRMKEHFHKEICRLGKLLDEKESLINTLVAEKHKLEEDKRFEEDTKEKLSPLHFDIDVDAAPQHAIPNNHYNRKEEL